MLGSVIDLIQNKYMRHLSRVVTPGISSFFNPTKTSLSLKHFSFLNPTISCFFFIKVVVTNLMNHGAVTASNHSYGLFGVLASNVRL